MRLLGIDFGERKIGLAISEGVLAEPWGIIKISNTRLPARQVKSQISNICRGEEVEKIVVGISEGRMAEKQRQFGRQLAKMTGLPVIFQDETLTSQEAIVKMRQIGRRIKDEDAISAALILENYLDRLKLEKLSEDV